MSLYAGLSLKKSNNSEADKPDPVEAATSKGISGWSTTFKAPLTRKRPNHPLPAFRVPAKSGQPPTTTSQATDKVPGLTHAPTTSSVTKATHTLPVPTKVKGNEIGHPKDPLVGLATEYNPLFPNQYDTCKAALEKQKQMKRSRRKQKKLSYSQSDHPSHSSLRPLSPPTSTADSTTHAVKNPTECTSIIVLCNMVGPGEVDDTLQEETAEECAKYGPVSHCLIYEVPDNQLPAEESVRIFVKFTEVDAARRAYLDLHGRYFGGRKVCVRFFDPVRFEKLDLAPRANDLDS
ncbi:hypothetical protein IWQ62_003918 [Dispira parvispora]|uniref:RNA recognition motif domain-containing protein n=1 Tax=Dispira parvispora TaxID=1520584 RepID=A0A9W8AQ20_9FUNG|nr:hypothetical protein IWQ62_003918 [Dispira parvispora]